MPNLRQQLQALIEALTPEMQKAFAASIDDIKSEIVLREVVDRLERQDIEGAIAALHIEPSAFRPLGEAIRQAFSTGGAFVAKSIPKLSDFLGARIVWRWDVSNQGAEAKISELSSKLITRETETTKEAARQAIVAGYAQGQGPNTIALDLVGRKSAVTGKREGGVIGLNGPQVELMNRTRINLLSGDPKLMKKYLTLQTRDKRFDGAVRKAIEAGKPLDVDTLNKVMMRLRDRNLKLRGDTIARTETVTSVMSAKHEAYLQALDASGRDESLVTRKWRNSGKKTSRDTHQHLNGQEVKGMTQPFVSLSGAMMCFPGDTSLGAPASEIVNCECDQEYNFDFAEAFARSRGR